MAWNIEVTDTFAGEANYCWVSRYSIPSSDNDTQRKVMRKAKSVSGFTGQRGKTASFGDSYTFRPSGACIIMLVQWAEG